MQADLTAVLTYYRHTQEDWGVRGKEGGARKEGAQMGGRSVRKPR